MKSLLPLLAFAALGEPALSQCNPQLQDVLSASDAVTDANFGHSVDVSGQVAVVGAWHDDENGFYSGATYVFREAGGVWTEEMKLLPSNAGIGDEFGISCAVEDGLAAVGAWLEDSLAPDAGSVYIFVENGGVWTEETMLVAGDGALADHFGKRVALSGDTLVVGAELDDDLGNNSGSAYVFVRSGTMWTQQDKLTASDGATNNHFGSSVAIDGDTIVIGANHDVSGSAGPGAAYVFTRTGTTWTEQQKISVQSGADGDAFGATVAVFADSAAVGAPGQDDLGMDAGMAYVFVRSGTTWSQEESLIPPGGDAGDNFGRSVALGQDYLVVGAPGSDQAGFGVGAAYLFERSGTTWNMGTLLPAGTTPGSFGWPVAVDVDRAVIGAPLNDAAASNAGAVQALTLCCVGLGSPYCFGDGSGNACPCGNTGGAGEGCANSSGSGGVLAASGSLSASVDDLQFTASSLLFAQPALLFVGENALNGGNGILFGDGLRCAGLNVVRLGTMTPDATGMAIWGPGLGALGGWSSGDTRYFQGWYRDPIGTPCGFGFNLTHGVEATFVP